MPTIEPKDMICLVLCAGKGTRMRPLTIGRPKQLLRLCNVAVLDHIFAAVREAGIRKVGLIVDP
ncbi:MAG TPA: NTP transferase domain-containing protein, partial [Armatimonadota bacterium]|nr:NTP transferase domain-containing protein [Armatimonadota bacterium]